MRTVRLVAIDLDGTLLRPDVTVSGRARSALARVRAAGITVVLVSGRPHRSVRDIAAAAGIGGQAICGNGAVIYDLDRGEVVAAHPLAAEALRALVEGLRAAAPGVVCACEDVAGFRREAAYPFGGLAVTDEVVCADLDELAARPATKLLARHPELPVAELAARARAVAGAGAVVTWSGPSLVEISAAGVTKAFALAELCERSGVAAAEVLALGDMPNDLPMLAWAGWSVAMANATGEVLAAADEVTASNLDDGVAIVLERLVAGAVGDGAGPGHSPG